MLFWLFHVLQTNNGNVYNVPFIGTRSGLTIIEYYCRCKPRVLGSNPERLLMTTGRASGRNCPGAS